MGESETNRRSEGVEFRCRNMIGRSGTRALALEEFTDPAWHVNFGSHETRPAGSQLSHRLIQNIVHDCHGLCVAAFRYCLIHQIRLTSSSSAEQVKPLAAHVPRAN